LSLYEDIITNHLKFLFAQDKSITDVVIIDIETKSLVKTLCSQYGYVPAFSSEVSGYVQFCGIKAIIPC